MAIGTALAAFPGRRRRNPLDAVSAPVGDHDEDRDDHVLAGSPGG
jgi:hypothetical protein